MIEENLREKEINCKLVSIEENISKQNNFHMLEFVYYAEIEDFSTIKVLMMDGINLKQNFDSNL